MFFVGIYTQLTFSKNGTKMKIQISYKKAKAIVHVKFTNEREKQLQAGVE